LAVDARGENVPKFAKQDAAMRIVVVFNDHGALWVFPVTHRIPVPRALHKLADNIPLARICTQLRQIETAIEINELAAIARPGLPAKCLANPSRENGFFHRSQMFAGHADKI
jgi:hypothetical protein